MTGGPNEGDSNRNYGKSGEEKELEWSEFMVLSVHTRGAVRVEERA